MTEAVASTSDEVISYNPPGPQAAKFHAADGFVRGLMGPVGSGKSSSCCVEIVSKALAQKPWYDGVRRSRWAVIRNTYPELKSTTIKTWETWFPSNVAPIRWDTPITSTMFIEDIGDGTSMELEVLFLALDKPSETGKLRSLELTGAWINEASEIPKEIFDMVTQRVGRYPSKIKGGPSWSGVILDTNPQTTTTGITKSPKKKPQKDGSSSVKPADSTKKAKSTSRTRKRKTSTTSPAVTSTTSTK